MISDDFPPPTPPPELRSIDDKPPTPTISPSSRPLDDRPLRCLVVDDDALTRKLMSRMLQRLGCVVESAPNGQVAVEMIVTSDDAPNSILPGPNHMKKYDVVFLDNQMVNLHATLRKLFLMSFFSLSCPVSRLWSNSATPVGRTSSSVLLEMLYFLIKRSISKQVLISERWQLRGIRSYLTVLVCSVLTKPVLERSLKAMLALAQEQRTQISAAPA